MNLITQKFDTHNLLANSDFCVSQRRTMPYMKKKTASLLLIEKLSTALYHIITVYKFNLRKQILSCKKFGKTDFPL